MTKWFGFSRSIWAAAIPLIVAVLTASGIDTTDLAGELEKLGTAVSLLAAAGLTLWSRFKPSNTSLTVLPKP